MLEDDLDQHGRNAVAVVLKEGFPAPKGPGTRMTLMFDQIEIRRLGGPIPPGSAFQTESRQFVVWIGLHIIVQNFIGKTLGNFLESVEVVGEGPVLTGVGKGVFAFPCVN